MTVKTKITSTVARKLGPLPVWAWTLGLIGAVLVYRHVRSSREQTGGGFSLPQVRAATPLIPVAAEGASGGSGPGMPDLPSDLLAQFFAHQTATIDALTSALTGTSAADASPAGAAPGGESQAGAASGTVTAGGWTGEVDQYGVPISAGFGGFGSSGEWVGETPAPAPIEPGWSGPVDQYGVPVSAGFGGFDQNGQWIGDATTAYATSAFLPPPQEAPAPQVAVQPPVDIYTSDNQMQAAAVAAAGGVKPGKVIAY